MLTTYIVVVADDDARFIGRRKITRKETMHGSGSGLHVHIFLSSQLSSKHTGTSTTSSEESTAELKNYSAHKARERTRRQLENGLCVTGCLRYMIIYIR